MPKTLLLADDSKTIQQAVSMTFAGEDVRLITASDGEAALQAAKPAVSPGGSGSTMVMPRPPMPAGAQSKPPPSNPLRSPSAPGISAPPAAARPPAAKPPVTGPPAARTSASPLSSPGPGRPAAPPAKPPPVASRPPASPATDDDEDIPLDEEVVDD